MGVENRRLTTANGSLRATQNEIIAAANRPIVVRGFEMPLLEYADPVPKNLAGGQSAARQLVLIHKAHCGPCAEQMPIWEDLLRDTRFKNAETWIVSVGDPGEEPAGLVRILKDRGLPYRLLRARKPAVFSIATGITGAPATLLLQKEREVELVELGLADSEHLEFILTVLDSSTGAATAKMVRFSAGEALR